MNLQELMIAKIEGFGGIEKLSNEIEKCRELSPEKIWFDNMQLCFNNLFLNKVDVEEYALDYKQSSQDAVIYLKEFKKGREEKIYDFLIDLMEFKLEYINNIRKIS